MLHELSSLHDGDVRALVAEENVSEGGLVRVGELLGQGKANERIVKSVRLEILLELLNAFSIGEKRF